MQYHAVLLSVFVYLLSFSAQELETVEIGVWSGTGLEATFEYINSWSDDTVWPGKSITYVATTINPK